MAAGSCRPRAGSRTRAGIQPAGRASPASPWPWPPPPWPGWGSGACCTATCRSPAPSRRWRSRPHRWTPALPRQTSSNSGPMPSCSPWGREAPPWTGCHPPLHCGSCCRTRCSLPPRVSAHWQVREQGCKVHSPPSPPRVGYPIPSPPISSWISCWSRCCGCSSTVPWITTCLMPMWAGTWSAVRSYGSQWFQGAKLPPSWRMG